MHPQGVGALLLGEPLSNLTAIAPEIYEFRYELICFSQSTELTQKRKETAYEKTRCWLEYELKERYKDCQDNNFERKVRIIMISRLVFYAMHT